MKNFSVFLFLILCLKFSLFSQENYICKSCIKPNTKYYFSASQIYTKGEKLFVNLDGKSVYVNKIKRDNNGYYLKLWDDNDYCPNCGDWTWNHTFGCCANPPDKCDWSCHK